MGIRSNMFSPRAPVAALALAVSMLSLGASSAKAQYLLNWDRGLSPMQVERMVQASGYRLTGPVARNGGVYLANVLGREDDPERLVIDARDGRLLQRYGAAASHRQYAAADWSSPPRPQPGLFDGWFDRDDDSPAPRPPASVYGDAASGIAHPSLVRPAQAPPSQSSALARADDAYSPADPYVIPAPAAATPAAEKPKPKQQVKRKPESTPVARPVAAAPADAKPAPVAAQPAASPQASAEPQAAITPRVAAPARPTSVGVSTPAAPRVADTKPVVAPAPQAVPAEPPPKVERPKPALNDVPVAPLE
jgi:hypothetical protein